MRSLYHNDGSSRPAEEGTVLHRVTAHNFRNLERVDWSPGSGHHLVLGPNGAGKTSLIEAIYLASTTRSFRTSRPAEICRHGEPGFRVGLEVGVLARSQLDFSWIEGKRRRALNETEVPLVDHLAALPLVLWTAAEKELITGPPAIGRRVLDRGVVSLRPRVLEPLGRYRRALLQKRRLLESRLDRSTLAGFNRVMAEAGSEILLHRTRYVESLNRALLEVAARETLDLQLPRIRYSPSPSGSEDFLGVEEMFDVLEAAAPREIEARRPLVGPHRDRLRFLWDNREIRRVGSAGELKAIGLLLVAAQGEVLRAAGKNLVYLLDDLDTELDPGRLARLWRALGTEMQVVATSSRPAVWSTNSTARRWSMQGGEIAAFV